VFYSISKFLTEIGSGFAEDGIIWISGIIERSSELVSAELEVNTIYHLENLVRSYSTACPHNLELPAGEGSATAYLLREDILY
jgi:hypothetical protein